MMPASESVKAKYTMNELLSILLPKFGSQGIPSSVQCKLVNDLSNYLPTLNLECERDGLALKTIELRTKITITDEGELHEPYLDYIKNKQKKPFLYNIGQPNA